MKTAVPLPDELYRDAEELAARLETSRSELYRKALQDSWPATTSTRRGKPSTASSLGAEEDEGLRAAGQRVVKETEW